MGKQERLAELRARIPRVSPDRARELQEGGALLLDVREGDEIAGGSPLGAARLGRGFLELRIEEVAPDPDRTLVCMCAGGTRSLFAADDLVRLGYRDVRSLEGGFRAWQESGLPVEVPRRLDAAQRERYARHLLMPEVGEEGQLKLLESRVLLVGVGGLGSPVALYLAAAGVGTLGLVDDDVVDRSNLQRQVLHRDRWVGEPKVESARESLLELNPGIEIVSHGVRLTPENVDEILPRYQLVVDGADNFATRYLVNDACVKHGVPNVHGSVFRFEGQVAVFHPGHAARPGPCYRCVYPEPPPPELAPNCAEAGVLGVLPGVVGLLEAVEVVKLLLGVGDPLVGRLLHYDALAARFTEMELDPDPDCPLCAPGRSFPGYQALPETCRS